VNEQTSHQSGVSDDLRSLRRSRDERLLAGVLGGLARRLGVDPVILRIATVVLAIFGGVGIIIYAAGWLLIPDDGEDRSVAEKAIARGGDSPEPATIWLAAGLALAVILAAGGTFSSGVGTVLLVLAVAGVVVMLRRGDDLPPRAVRTQTSPDGEPLDGDAPSAATPAASPNEDLLTDDLLGGSAVADDAPAESGDITAPAQPLSFSGTAATAWPDPPDWPDSDIDPLEFATPEPPEPKKRSRSHLGSVTFSAVAVALGILAIVDAAGAVIPAAAYVALALAIIGLGLLIGTWYGRSRGLIVWGLLATFIALPVALVGDTLDWDLTGEDRTITIDQVAELPEDPASHGLGRVRYDLGGLELTGTDVRSLEVSQTVGALQVVVPPEVDVTVNASTGMGHIVAFDEEAGGHQDITVTDTGSDGPGGGQLTLDLSLQLGEITVERADAVEEQRAIR
jgi:phage shock protein PspC (stress-responsive transcriptional regulator)